MSDSVNKMAEIQIPIVKIKAEGNYEGHNQTANKLLNDNNKKSKFWPNRKSKWLNLKSTSWIECEFSDFFIIKRYYLESGGDQVTRVSFRDPKEWDLYGFTKNGESVLLDSKRFNENPFGPEPYAKLNISLAQNTIAVNKIRLVLLKTSTEKGFTDSYVQLGRLRFFGNLGENNSKKNKDQSNNKANSHNAEVQTDNRAVSHNAEVQSDNRADSHNAEVQSNARATLNAAVQSNTRANSKNATVQSNARANSKNATVQSNARANSKNAAVQSNNRLILGNLKNTRRRLISRLETASNSEIANIERFLQTRKNASLSTESLQPAVKHSILGPIKVRPSTAGILSAGGSNLANLRLRSLGGIGNQRPASARNITNRRKVGTLLSSLGNRNEVNLPGSVRNSGGGGGGGGYSLPPLKIRSESKEEERPQSAGILGRLKFFGSGSVKEQSVSLKLGHELLKAIKEDNSEKALSLISQGADINITGINGNNPLLLALEKKLPDVAEKLLELGAIVGEGERRYKILVASKGTPLMQKILSKKRKRRCNRTRKN
jgi:hypothetical protein